MSDRTGVQNVFDLIPPTNVIRFSLAAISTETCLLRSLLRLAIRRDKEAERLSSVCQHPPMPGGANHA